MPRIDDIRANTTTDTRGNPTIEVLMRSGKYEASAKVPSGKSAGSGEAHELRDKDGKGVSGALRNVNELISPILVGHALEYAAIDRSLIELDGTKNKTQLGANAMLGVSLAALRLEAICAGTPLWKYIAQLTESESGVPHLYMNMLNGGAHANFRLPFQEYIVVVGGRGAYDSYAKANQIFEVLGTLVEREYGKVAMGDEGGYSPEIRDIRHPFELLQNAASGESGVFLAIDAAASEFFLDGKYIINGAPFGRDELLEMYRMLSRDFNVRSIEDPFDEDDLDGFSHITNELGGGILVVGDDLTVTNPKQTEMMIEKKSANAMIIKPNQIGTVSEVFETIRLAKAAGWKLIVSHRSGETDDTFIADLAFGVGAYGLKAGAPTQRERRVKYERLIEIEKEFSHR